MTKVGVQVGVNPFVVGVKVGLLADEPDVEVRVAVGAVLPPMGPEGALFWLPQASGMRMAERSMKQMRSFFIFRLINECRLTRLQPSIPDF
jgi:hypothetical protein